ncbi:cupin domain-containing protein [candidate division WOR-3 bacterium]|uniref:Cupin domain-containing protein n=1 Tax=candidate division WOR-3 bacterium TaxID=2052148 RepID=A0A937XDJ1_UNCW3|nr:cupin domain-containing protein [candidate division WOR-3 bacterium]
MLTGHFTEVKEEQPHLAGMQATIRWLIAAKDGAPHFAMRVIEIKRNGEKIPLHHHDYEHEVFIIEGKGNIVSPDGVKPVAYGNFAYIPAGEEHGFENTGDRPFRFICVIPKQ